MYSSTLPSSSALDGGGWSTPRPGRFTPGKDPVSNVQEAGWAPGPVWTGAEILSPTGIRVYTENIIWSDYTTIIQTRRDFRTNSVFCWLIYYSGKTC